MQQEYEALGTDDRQAGGTLDGDMVPEDLPLPSAASSVQQEYESQNAADGEDQPGDDNGAEVDQGGVVEVIILCHCCSDVLATITCLPTTSVI